MRYQRHSVLLGKEYSLLHKKTITIVGLGALGTNIANLLARAGINLILIDNDKVDITNLQRQSLYNEKDIKKPKVTTAKSHLNKINSEIKIKTYNQLLTKKNISIINSDLIIDCTDNLETRFLINEYCHNKFPWIHTAAIKTMGVTFNILPNKPCFNCIYKNISSIEKCEDVGILNTIIALISSIAATQAMKILLNKDYETDLIRFNIWNNKLEKIKVKKSCNLCKNKKENKFIIKLCKTKAAYSTKINKKLNLNQISKKYKTIVKTPILLIIKVNNHEIIVHNYGELIFKDLKDEDKINKIAKEIYNESSISS
ncbi:MAG: HesA/MoeB/ThiF family protein [Nanoarchaeota archaeon]|nr:HesA/MoeB/ThiF family protein [Nanoarchaeota archaeon]